ncbi:MAG: V-type ATPase subunit [Spirochaetia bacterium]
MAGQLQAYSFINAKLRARIGELAERSFFRSLASSASVDDAVSSLAEHGFTDVAEAYRDTGDVRMCEQVLYRREVEILLEVERHFDEARRAFVSALGDRYEIENVKTALRLWFESAVRGKHVESKIAYLSRESVHRKVDLDAIVNAASAEDIPAALADTPYEAAVSRNLERMRTTGSLFWTERALDCDYFERVLDTVGRLPERDRKPALDFVSLEADRENVFWILRGMSYYRLGEQEVLSGVVPGGSMFDHRSLREIARSGQPASAVLERLGAVSAAGPRDGGRQARELEVIDAALDETMDRLVHRYHGSYPFTMGIVLAYYVLVQRQIHRVATVLNGLAYGLSAQTLEAAL